MLPRFMSLMLLTVFAAGCGLHAQSYVMTKQRVGIEKGNGNAGYLAGTPQYIEPQRKTRQVYVLELTKPIPENEVKKIEQEISTVPNVNTHISLPTTPAPRAPVAGESHNKIVIPRIDDEPMKNEVHQATVSPTGPAVDTTYTIVKDDTLQKISKKYYGSYGGWLKIYNANKDKIKNPNLLKSGTVITIPAVK
ncbi:MAG: LysM peptidoglycan-binding domain-containing protein [Candidatus Omnitrophota bacterium]